MVDPTPSSIKPTQIKTLWGRARFETIVPYVIAGVALAAAVIILGHETGRHIDALEAWIAGQGPWALVTFTLLFVVLSSVFVPDILFGIIAGTSFGFTWGLVGVVAGTLLGAALQYTLARLLFKPTIDRFLASKPALTAIQAAVRQQEFKLQLLIRLTPLNRALTSYMLGAASVGFTRFVAACVALLPSLCVEVYCGYAGRHLARLATEPKHVVVLRDIGLIAGLVVAIVVMVLISRTARRAIEAVAAAALSQAPSVHERATVLEES